MIDLGKDPICGMKVDEKNVKYVSTHMGSDYYFCSADCKGTFDRNPMKYAR